MKNATKVLAAALLAALVIPGLVLAQEGPRKWSFNDDEMGAVPAGWRVAETNGQGLPATWAVVGEATAPLPPNAVAVTESRNTGSTYNLLLAEGTSYQDLDLDVHVKAVSGEEDRGGGPAWRVLDANNYYAARWNPLEENLRVYVVENGKRKMLGSTTVKADPNAWHEIRVQAVGDRILVQFDEGTFLEVQDAAIQKPGKIGLWTKADAATAFDEVTVTATAAPAEPPAPQP